MRGYDDATYGDAFADVYDDWYADLGGVEGAVRMVTRLAGGGPVLELGVGTGRLAVPLAAAGLDVHGVDTSAAMLDRLRRNDPTGSVRAVAGDMVDDLPSGPFAVVLVAYNTLFNLRSAQRQQACFAAVAERLTPQGAFVVEAFVPERAEATRSAVSVRSLDARSVVLSVSVDHPQEQTAEGQFIEISEGGGVRMRPWSIRWSTPLELDAMAAAVGLRLRERWGSFDTERYDDDSGRHVSVYTR